jgi:hypothetical protein
MLRTNMVSWVMLAKPATRWLACVVACLLALFAAPAPALGQATLPYSQDFEGTIGSEWSVVSTLTHPTHSRVLGNFGNTGTTLSISTTPGQRYDLLFDLWAFDSWDGVASGDVFRVLVDGTQRLTANPRDNVPAREVAAGMFFVLPVWSDRLYSGLLVSFTATNATTIIAFDGEGLEDLASESWALDNVSVRASPPGVPYTADFERNHGSEWSVRSTIAVAGYGRALGQFDNTGSTLTLSTVSGTDYTVIFDLWAFDSWDGDGRACCGPDFFRVLVNGTLVYNVSPAMFFGFGSTIPEIPEVHTTNYAVGPHSVAGWGDKLYRRIAVNFTASGSTTTIEFDANGLSGGTDESWAIDNVRVVPRASASALLPIFRGRSEVSGLVVENTNTSGATTGALWLDLNNDGTLESVQGGTSLVARYWNGASYTGLGNPTMQAPFVAMDTDNNGTLELWIRNGSGTTEGLVYTGTGSSAVISNRTGANTTLFASVSGLRAAAPLDADSDGRIDLAMMGTGGNRLAINRGVRTDGTLEAFRLANLPSATSDVGSGAWVATGDLNNDTIPDIYWSNSSGRIWLSNGAGGYAASDWGLSVLNSASNPAGAVFADIDNDRDLDLFVGRRGTGLAPTLWINNGTAFVEQASSRGLGALRDVVDASFGDIDNDGDLDIFYVTASGFSGCALNSGSSGGYNFVVSDVGLTTESRGSDTTLVDVDGDGDLDASFTSNSSPIPSRHWLNTLNNGNQSLTVRVIGKGAGYINTAAIGTRVELWDATNTQFLQRRDVGLAKGAGGMTPLWVHFGGVDENTTYTLRVWGRGTIYSVPVTPAAASTTFTSGTRQRFYTFDENVHAPRVQVVQFREAMQGE